jgi:hypothetical protein
MLKPTDKVSFGLMSEMPGCNVSERRQYPAGVDYLFSQCEIAHAVFATY